jgi:hypothetical protein
LKFKKLPEIQIKPPKTLRQTKTAGNIFRYFFCGGFKPPVTLGGKFEIQKTAGNFAADKHRQ